MSPTRIRPGTSAFRRALLTAFENDSSLRPLGTVEFLSEERTSRNTVIYRCRIGNERLVAKAQITKPASVAVAEYQILQEMHQRFGTGAVRSLRPVALFRDLGVLVTKEEQGTSLRSLLEGACEDPSSHWYAATAGVRAAAWALRAFHDAYPGPDHHEDGPSHLVRTYMDFSPKNVLIRTEAATSGPEVILMDPPEEERWGDRADDVGGFCFDMTRVSFLPGFLFRRSASVRIDWLKAWFLHSYYRPWYGGAWGTVCRRVKGAECRRADQALRWYLRPWRYSSVLKETARLCYLGPITALHRFRGVHRSYSRVERFLEEGAPRWSRSDDPLNAT